MHTLSEHVIVQQLSARVSTVFTLIGVLSSDTGQVQTTRVWTFADGRGVEKRAGAKERRDSRHTVGIRRLDDGLFDT
jgi:hypothetical protein